MCGQCCYLFNSRQYFPRARRAIFWNIVKMLNDNKGNDCFFILLSINDEMTIKACDHKLWNLKFKTKSAQRHGPKYPIDLNDNDEIMSYEEGSKYVDSSNNVSEQNKTYPEHSLIIETQR